MWEAILGFLLWVLTTVGVVLFALIVINSFRGTKKLAQASLPFPGRTARVPA